MEHFSSFRAIRSQQIQRESLQRDYVFLLQTLLSTEDGRLFGGTKVKKNLSISRKIGLDC